MFADYPLLMGVSVVACAMGDFPVDLFSKICVNFASDLQIREDLVSESDEEREGQSASIRSHTSRNTVWEVEIN